MQLRVARLFFFALFLLAAVAHAQQDSRQWPTYGGDPGGMRYANSSQITRANLTMLSPVWTFHTGSFTAGRPGSHYASFEATPILFRGLLYFSSPFDEVFAIDPATGARRWKYDPVLSRNQDIGLFTSRGVAAWASHSAAPTSTCAARIFVATMDSRLIAMDAATGIPCADFGYSGSIDLTHDVFYQPGQIYYNTSPPTVIGNLVIVGSSIVDNERVDIESGLVRAFDCISGKLVWSWEPIPWARQQKLRTGAANAWGVIAADPGHGLIFIPTGSASPDFYGGSRPGDNRDANSVVALDAASGRRIWGFQVVHHDLWDYDVAAEPLLFTFRGNIPAIAITTKMGLVFVLNRLTGQPLFPVTERPVPASDLPEESPSLTQPFQDIASLSPIYLPPNAQLGASPQDDRECRAIFASLRYEGIYTPPSLRGTLLFPGNVGGVNWGSAALDPATNILYANTNRYPYSITFTRRPTGMNAYLETLKKPKYLVSLLAILLEAILLFTAMFLRRSFFPGRGALLLALALLILLGFLFMFLHRRAQFHSSPPPSTLHFGYEFGNQFGTPYTVVRQQIIAPGSKHPCTPMPWGTVSAINLNTGKSVWQTPLGTNIPGRQTGTINLGGDIVTASGLIFTGASEEPYLRAFDASTGAELWKGSIPAPAQSTPMSYTIDHRQYIVIAAGGHRPFGTPTADTLVAFALRRAP